MPSPPSINVEDTHDRTPSRELGREQEQHREEKAPAPFRPFLDRHQPPRPQNRRWGLASSRRLGRNSAFSSAGFLPFCSCVDPDRTAAAFLASSPIRSGQEIQKKGQAYAQNRSLEAAIDLSQPSKKKLLQQGGERRIETILRLLLQPPRARLPRLFRDFVYCVPLRGAAAATTPVRESATRARVGAATRFMVVLFLVLERGSFESEEKNYAALLPRLSFPSTLSLSRFASLQSNLDKKTEGNRKETPWRTADDTRPSCTCSRRMTWRRS